MNQAKVLSCYMENPCQTGQEMAKKLNLSKTTVLAHLSDLGIIFLKAEYMEKWLENDLSMYYLAQREMMKRLSNPKKAKEIPTRDLLTMIDHVTKRITFISDRLDYMFAQKNPSWWWNTEHEVLDNEQQEALKAISFITNIQQNGYNEVVWEIIDG